MLARCGVGGLSLYRVQSSLIRPRAGERELHSRMFGTHHRHHADEPRPSCCAEGKKIQSSLIFKRQKQSWRNKLINFDIASTLTHHDEAVSKVIVVGLCLCVAACTARYTLLALAVCVAAGHGRNAAPCACTYAGLQRGFSLDFGRPPFWPLLARRQGSAWVQSTQPIGTSDMALQRLCKGLQRPPADQAIRRSTCLVRFNTLRAPGNHQLRTSSAQLFAKRKV